MCGSIGQWDNVGPEQDITNSVTVDSGVEMLCIIELHYIVRNAPNTLAVFYN